MLKRPITYTNLMTNELVTEDFYFNLSKPELLEMEFEVEGGMAVLLQKIIETNSGRDLIKTFKDIILRSYGVRTPDGKGFEKSEELSRKFSQMTAFHVLFMELSTSSEAAATFIKGVMPADMVEDIERAETADKQKNVAHDGRVTTTT